MTRVAFFLDAGVITGFSCKGHADDDAVQGHDLVCAAISALTTTCVNALESVAGTPPDVRVDDGFLEARLPGGGNHDAQVLFRALRQGLEDLRAAYPKHIRLTERVGS